MRFRVYIEAAPGGGVLGVDPNEAQAPEGAEEEPQADHPHQPVLLRVHLSMVNGQWSKAEEEPQADHPHQPVLLRVHLSMVNGQ